MSAPTPGTDPRPAPDPAGHGRRVAGMFGRIAGWYDFLNHALSLGMDLWWRYRLVRHVRRGPTGRVLDLAAGTLDVTVEILRQHPWARVLAMDFSLPMLRKGRPKLKGGRADRALPALADGRCLPLPDACVDSVTIAFGIRNILPRAEAYAEIHRVLAPGGRLCILEFGSGQRRVWKGLYNFYLHQVLPTLGRVFSGDAKAYAYLADTIAAFPEPGELAAELARAGFARVSWHPMLSGIVAVHLAEKAE
ncbi:MAG: ubiquinone/menaquinone biosynthesis methyltransferase [Thermodesulfobacteriota bacterium]